MIQFELEGDKSLFRDSFQFAQKQVQRLVESHPDFYPMYTQGGKWKHSGPAWTHWCDGFLPGLMWRFRKQAASSGNGAEADRWMEWAIRYSKPLEARQFDEDVHDLGFIFLPTYYPWYQATRERNLVEVLIQAGKTMALRYQEKGQYLKSFVGENSLFIDIMMNVGIIFFAARETNDKRLREIAVRHALTTRKFLVRGDGSVAQEGLFNPDTGEFLSQTTQQGYRGDSCWSRGLAWAMYGFGTSYEYSRDPRFLETAEACADYYISHGAPNGLVPWDFNAPGESKRIYDTSAAAIAASALLRLSRLLSDPMKGHLYWTTGIRILRTLCCEQLGNQDAEWEGVLKGGVYHMQKRFAVNESVIWGDYYLVEALEHALRFIQ